MHRLLLDPSLDQPGHQHQRGEHADHQRDDDAPLDLADLVEGPGEPPPPGKVGQRQPDAGDQAARRADGRVVHADHEGHGAAADARDGLRGADQGAAHQVEAVCRPGRRLCRSVSLGFPHQSSFGAGRVLWDCPRAGSRECRGGRGRHIVPDAGARRSPEGRGPSRGSTVRAERTEGRREGTGDWFQAIADVRAAGRVRGLTGSRCETRHRPRTAGCLPRHRATAPPRRHRTAP